MVKRTRIGMLGLMLTLALAAVAWLGPAPAIAQQGQGALHVRRWKHMVDGGGQLFLSIQFLNEGTHSIILRGIAPTRSGPWITISKKIDPGATHRALMKVGQHDPAHVWADTSEGLLVFTPPPRAG